MTATATESLTLLDDAIKNLHEQYHNLMENVDITGMTPEQLMPVTDKLNQLLDCANNAFSGMLLLEARAVLRQSMKVKLPEFVFTYRNYVDNNTHCVFGTDANMDAFLRKFGNNVQDVKKRKLEPSQNYIFIHRAKTGLAVTSEYTGTMEDYIRKVQDEQDRVLIDAILLD